MRRFVTVLALLLIGCGAPDGGPTTPPPAPIPPGVEEPDQPYVVMVSFDGMRHDFIDRVPTPAFDRVARDGAKADGLIPSYPSKTFPNHYTLATGLYPARHGIVDNAFYDPSLDAVYRLGDPEKIRDGRWYGGEPLWVTAERQGLKTASFYWVGSEAAIQGVRPTYFKYYDDDFPYEARIDTVLHWLSLPLDERPRLVLLYFSEPDHVAHVEGPGAAAVDTVVGELDRLLGVLLDGIERLPIADYVHVVLVSDHGMAEVPPAQVLYLDDYVDLAGVRWINNTTQALLYFDGNEDRLWAVHDALADHLEHANVYLREETPPEWHYRGSHRIGDLVVAADPGWVLRQREAGPWRAGGMHGWDPASPAMRGIFLASGPAISPGVRVPAFENIHVYPLVTHLLGIRPAADIDGRLEVLEPMLLAPAAQ